MKPIATPTFRKRTDGIQFQAPPSSHGAYNLTNSRLTEENFVNQMTYSLDQQDIAFLHRYNSYLSNPSSEGLNLQILTQLMTAFEIAAYKELHVQDQNYQTAKLQQQLQQQQQQQQSSTSNINSNSNNNASGTDTILQQQQPHQGALERASVILSSANITGKLEEVTINVADAIKRATTMTMGSTNKAVHLHHPAINDQKMQAKILELVKAHWLERRKAMGTALLPVLRPLPYGNGVFRNQQLGEHDEPFTSREIKNCLVFWRPTSAQQQSQQNIDENTQSNDQKMALIKERERLEARKRMKDKKKSKEILNNALALMLGIVKREEKKLEHAHLLTTELALARRCRQLPGSAFITTSTKNDQQQPVSEDHAASSPSPLIDVCPFAESRRANPEKLLTQREREMVLKVLEQKVQQQQDEQEDEEEEDE